MSQGIKTIASLKWTFQIGGLHSSITRLQIQTIGAIIEVSSQEQSIVIPAHSSQRAAISLPIASHQAGEITRFMRFVLASAQNPNQNIGPRTCRAIRNCPARFSRDRLPFCVRELGDSQSLGRQKPSVSKTSGKICAVEERLIIEPQIFSLAGVHATVLLCLFSSLSTEGRRQ
jgi:hypothetical protein